MYIKQFIMLTEYEIELLEIAEQLIEDNKHLNAKLGGSLMLRLRGYALRRPVSDIDIICDYVNDQYKEDAPIINTLEFVKVDKNSHNSDLLKRIIKNRSVSTVVQYNHKNTNIKIDFLKSKGDKEIILGVPCGSDNEAVRAKLSYIKRSNNEETCKKT